KILQSRSYKSVQTIKKWMDDYFLDGIIGLVSIPGLRDINKILSFPYVYVSLFKVRSISLTLAVVFNILLDVLIGALPFLGNIADFFFRSYAKNYKLIVGFVEGDQEIITMVKKRAIWMVIGIGIACYLIYLVIS